MPDPEAIRLRRRPDAAIFRHFCLLSLWAGPARATEYAFDTAGWAIVARFGAPPSTDTVLMPSPRGTPQIRRKFERHCRLNHAPGGKTRKTKGALVTAARNNRDLKSGAHFN
ncbi:MAG: hypothetical protein EXS42_09300 [Lacunisphaera sp.]|nr:hypothetical protein [Lacunisphaera sp.]